MREDYKITKKAQLYSSSNFSSLHKHARTEICSRFTHLLNTPYFNFNRYFKKHLGFEYIGSYNNNSLRGTLVIVVDESKFFFFKLKYGI